MRHAVLSAVVASVLVVPALYAASPQVGQATPPSQAQTAKAKPAARAHGAASQIHVVSAEFVSYDAKTKMVTMKDDKGQTSSAPLEGGAIREVTQLHLKAGDHVMVTCRDNAKGEHQAVTNIRTAKAK